MVPELRVEEPFFAYNAGDPDFIDAFGNTRTIERDSSSMAYSWRERGVWHRERVRPPTGIEALLGDPGVTNFREEIFLSNLASPKTLFDTEAKADGDGNDEIVTMTGITNVKMVAGACIARGSPGNLSIMDKSSGCLFNTLELSGATCAATAGCENDFYDAGSLTATNKAVYAGYVNFGSTTHPMSRPVDVWQWLPATQKWTQLNRPFGVQTRFGTHELLLNDGAKVFVIAPQAPNFWLAAYDDTTPPTLSASVLSTAK
ncbi:MAG TPA: hypothetical protein VGJ84_16970, partial [Polyangiaceae bacterium]